MWVARRNCQILATADSRLQLDRILEETNWDARGVIRFESPDSAKAVICHKYADLDCLDPAACPNVYAQCWQYRIWER